MAHLNRLNNQLRNESDPQQFQDAQSNQVWVTVDHTQADLNREREQRAKNYQRQIQAEERRSQAQTFLMRAKSRSKPRPQAPSKRPRVSSSPRKQTKWTRQGHIAEESLSEEEISQDESTDSSDGHETGVCEFTAPKLDGNFVDRRTQQWLAMVLT